MEVLADLIHSGAIQHLDYIYIDFHKWMDKDHRSFRYLIYLSECRDLRFKDDQNCPQMLRSEHRDWENYALLMVDY